MVKYFFDKPLISGLIKSRPNRFIMNVEIEGKIEKCHCPSTGRIGNIKFNDIPCLLSMSDNQERKTGYTVEAISVNGKWVGINQTKVNRYIEFFLRNGLLREIIRPKELRREVKLGKSRIDFLVDENFLEVKMPLMDILIKGVEKDRRKFTSFDRLIKHFNDISKIAKGKRAILLMCYLYDAFPFEVPKENVEKKIVDAARKATKKGLEHWQVNLRIDREGVSFVRCFKLNLFD